MTLEVTPIGDTHAFWDRLTSLKPQPCLLLRDNLTEASYVEMARKNCMFNIEYEGAWRDVIVFGMWNPDADVQEDIDALVGDGDFEILEEHPDASGVLLSNAISDAHREAMHQVFEIEKVEIEGKPREQIVLVWYTPQFYVRKKNADD